MAVILIAGLVFRNEGSPPLLAPGKELSIRSSKSLNSPSLSSKSKEPAPSVSLELFKSSKVPSISMFLETVSKDEAQITSPLGSTAKALYLILSVETKVLKLRYLIRSQALTVPSNEEENITCPFLANFTAVTAEVCSSKVARQNPETISQILILPSSDAVTILEPSGE
ncbi:hypothetical protein WICMUC_001068 [Wickerhamomyces mucosus]|uniref:Uncharacterized protein n=1 Tax=Wickerhamomyces mucosus TaxID=1378264 RepID=A0A9P8PVZ5_9ASCO|nr:hypothetical protein WICMUC_001068 [Wickerhamomyces mucosus]